MILDFPFLDNIINETLRMLPPLARLVFTKKNFFYSLEWLSSFKNVRIERECTKDFSYKNIHIKKGTIVSVPTFALHNDEDYYSNPSTFNPDRYQSFEFYILIKKYICSIKYLEYSRFIVNLDGVRKKLAHMSGCLLDWVPEIASECDLPWKKWNWLSVSWLNNCDSCQQQKHL